jgi:hypothetical protein
MSTRAPGATAESGPRPEPGDTLYLEKVIGGPWDSVMTGASGDTMTISAPRRGGSAVGLAPGRALLISYAKNLVPCEVDAVWVDGPSEVGGEQIAVVRLTGTPRRMQRRSAVRVPVQLLVSAQAVGGAGEGPAWGTAAVTENLSAGGALLRLADPVDPGVEIPLTIRPPADGADPGDMCDHMQLVGRVVRCDRDRPGPCPWRVALAFVDLTPAQEEAMVRYIFRLQREARARESGMAS